MMFVLLWGCAKPSSQPVPAPAVQEPVTTKPEGADTVLSLFGARHPEDVPDAEKLRQHNAPASVHWVALEGRSLLQRSRAVRALADFPGSVTDDVCREVWTSGHPKLKAAALVCLTTSSSDVRPLFEEGATHSDARVSDAATAGLQQRGWPVPAPAERPSEE